MEIQNVTIEDAEELLDIYAPCAGCSLRKL